MNKVVQISATSDANGYPILYALCDDGTIWLKMWGSIWEQIDTP